MRSFLIGILSSRMKCRIYSYSGMILNISFTADPAEPLVDEKRGIACETVPRQRKRGNRAEFRNALSDNAHLYQMIPFSVIAQAKSTVKYLKYIHRVIHSTMIDEHRF